MALSLLRKILYNLTMPLGPPIQVHTRVQVQLESGPPSRGPNFWTRCPILSRPLPLSCLGFHPVPS